MDETRRKALFAQIIDEHCQALRRLCTGYERGEAQRHDLEQEILLNLWRALPRYRGDASLRTWVYRVAHNTAAKHVRTATRRPKGTADEKRLAREASPAAGPEEAVAQSDARARLGACIAQLRPVDRQIIVLYLEEVPQAESGEIVGLSQANVSTRVNRIKTELKGMMSP